jgi:hypothetical protein
MIEKLLIYLFKNLEARNDQQETVLGALVNRPINVFQNEKSVLHTCSALMIGLETSPSCLVSPLYALLPAEPQQFFDVNLRLLLQIFVFCRTEKAGTAP